jgi:hypothetical protein
MLLDTHLINTMGRRRTLRLPDRQSTDTLGRHAIRDRSAHPFAPGVTLQDIDSRVAAGAVVKAIRQPPGDTVIPLAAVSTDGTVNLQPGYSAPGADDTMIALVGGWSNIKEST